MSRLILILVLLNGLIPSFVEIVETVVHYGQTGHLVHASQDEQDLEHLGDEHGCGPMMHLCGCHSSQPLLVDGASVISVAVGYSGRRQLLPPPEEPHPSGVPNAPFRPPISVV